MHRDHGQAQEQFIFDQRYDVEPLFGHDDAFTAVLSHDRQLLQFFLAVEHEERQIAVQCQFHVLQAALADHGHLGIQGS